ncbi:MAG: ImmA/IrrE family metallo-endopeptidase [Oligoflexales bacterium]|nr:ImmA/IrrE family metallo-endopeptidase [Oligoflexales bacterium]
MLAIFPQLKSCVEKGQREHLAVLVRQYFGGDLAKKPQIDMEGLVEDFGIAVCRGPLSQYVGATLVEDQNGKFKVSLILSDGFNKSERQFMLAHMLGHFLFDIQSQLAMGDLSTRGLSESISPLVRYEQAYYPDIKKNRDIQREERADDFAACLLMPKGMFLKAYETLKDEALVANMFGVSEECVKQRYLRLVAEQDKRQTEEGFRSYAENSKKIEKTKLKEKIEVGQSLKPAKKTTNQAISAEPKQEDRPGLKKLRKLAKKLDSSVKI